MPKNANKIKVIICSKCGGPAVVTQSAVNKKIKKCLHCGTKLKIKNAGCNG